MRRSSTASSNYQLIDEQEIISAKALLAEIVALLVTMARNLDKRGAR